MRVLKDRSSSFFVFTAALALLSLAAALLTLGFLLPVAFADDPISMYRLYNPNSGEHFYTASSAERDWLSSVGWSYEGVGWYSDDERGVPLYRQFNPNVDPAAPTNNSGSHNYTKSKDENDWLVSLGWNEEGIGWYGVGDAGGNGGNGGSNSGGNGSSASEPSEQKTWVPEQGHWEPVYTTIVDQEAYTTYTHVYYTRDGWSGTDRDEAREHHAIAGGHLGWYDIPEEHPAVTHQEQTGQRWVVDVPGHWE